MTKRDRYTVSTKYWHKLEDGRIQCDLCPRFCKLHADQRGLCFVRQNLDEQIVLTTYGRSSGYCIDLCVANSYSCCNRRLKMSIAM